VNLKPYLVGKRKGGPHKTLMWQYQYGRAAIREGDWKLIRLPDRPAELFNIGEDPSELVNLAREHPDIVRMMYKKLFDWEQTMDEPLWNTDLRWRAVTMGLYDEFKHERR